MRRPGGRRAVPYRREPKQFGDLRLPAVDRLLPLAIVVRGRAWRALYNLIHAGHMCVALCEPALRHGTSNTAASAILARGPAEERPIAWEKPDSLLHLDSCSVGPLSPPANRKAPFPGPFAVAGRDLDTFPRLDRLQFH